jgi:site-specific DNA recombinase
MARRRNGKASEPTPERVRCAIYTRKSTDKGLEQSFNSLDAQREACERYIANQSYQGWFALDTRYDDGGFTGANTERPAFQRLLDDVDAGLVDVILVYKVDRLSRSLVDFSQVIARLDEKGVAFVSVTQNFSTADAMGRLTRNMLISFAEFEREMIAERTRDKIAASRRKGKWTGGAIPLGYDVRDRKLIINRRESTLVRLIFERYLVLQSTMKLMRELNEAGHRTKVRKRRDGTKGHGAVWSSSAVVRVLRNPIFAGLMPLGDETFEGEHKGLIDREIFDEVGRIMDGHTPAHAATHGRNPAYILRGVLYCGCCGMHFTPASTRKKGREYRYYRCTTRDKGGAKACDGRSLPADAIEGFVVDKLGEEVGRGDLAAGVYDALQARISRKLEVLGAIRQRLPREIADLAAEGKKLVSGLKGAGSPGDRVLEARIDEVGAGLEAAELRLAGVEREIAKLEAARATQAWVSAVLKDFDAIWNVMTDENRGRLVRALVARVEVDEPSGDINITLAGPRAGLPGDDADQDEHEEEPCGQDATMAM